jgi:hypothetical protein
LFNESGEHPIAEDAGRHVANRGTDHPFGNSANTAAALQKVGLAADELRAIDRDNALRLMSRNR